ncbi:hypothetical protein QN399_18805 [Pseudomonas sp. 10C3]|uniref:hypothetical protein n=1 Tax=Pseudomonas sp. 10C3 TaxID=3118753 RepID=UPI002E80ED3F|nr:hypothetical protein [Pseudomonas sp. 10C3]MEE3508290.1 hypothetical protein [Pseudomonas sp. 10C3]
MSSITPLHQAIEKLESDLANIPGAGGIPVRIVKVISQVLDHWKENKTADDIGSLTDGELLRALTVSSAVVGALNTRETRKLIRRAEAKIEFFEKLEEFGGLYKSKKVTEILRVTRQTVSTHVSKGTLIAIQEGKDYCFPGFQFVEKAKLPHLEEILGILKGSSPESICTFFLNPITVTEGKYEMPYRLLKKGADKEELSAIKREAALFMTGVPS